jgi:hypothetical protein
MKTRNISIATTARSRQLKKRSSGEASTYSLKTYEPTLRALAEKPKDPSPSLHKPEPGPGSDRQDPRVRHVTLVVLSLRPSNQRPDCATSCNPPRRSLVGAACDCMGGDQGHVRPPGTGPRPPPQSRTRGRRRRGASVESMNARNEGDKMSGAPHELLVRSSPPAPASGEARVLGLILLERAGTFPSPHRRVTPCRMKATGE